MSTQDRYYIRQTRIDHKLHQAIQSAMRRENLRKADAIRWLATKGAQLTGHWPDDAYLNVPKALHILVDPGVEYVADGNGGDEQDP
jgi:hypothetical protein